VGFVLRLQTIPYYNKERMENDLTVKEVYEWLAVNCVYSDPIKLSLTLTNWDESKENGCILQSVSDGQTYYLSGEIEKPTAATLTPELLKEIQKNADISQERKQNQQTQSASKGTSSGYDSKTSTSASGSEQYSYRNSHTQSMKRHWNLFEKPELYNAFKTWMDIHYQAQIKIEQAKRDLSREKEDLIRKQEDLIRKKENLIREMEYEVEKLDSIYSEFSSGLRKDVDAVTKKLETVRMEIGPQADVYLNSYCKELGLEPMFSTAKDLFKKK